LLAKTVARRLTKSRIFLLTSLAMVAFASNSLLCRLALKQTGIDPATFTSLRIFSGAVALWLIITRMRRTSSNKSGNWPSAFALFIYAAAFSFAYVTLSAGTGALLLFGAVQVTMIVWGLHTGERLDIIQILGLIVALAGLVVLVFPGLSAPPLIGSTFMLSAGVAWGIYSVRGKAAGDAIAVTTGNFVRAALFAAVISLALIARAHVDVAGIRYAIISGAITSGLGYVIWYSALSSGLKATSAATVQLSVPVLAAGGGILLLGEPITLRYFLASVAVLGGIALVIWERAHANRTCDMKNDEDNLQLSAVEDHNGILTIRGGGPRRDWNGIHYKQGMSGKNVGTTGLSANIATIPPGGVAYAHIHVGFEVILYIIEGKVRHEFGEGLKQVIENEAGDFIYIKPGVPHEVFNMSETEPVVAFVARSSADEWDNIIPYERNQG
jgi:drug/metabolite transporter (DMT)-like permease/uncharacterized RmlC-like cupin family protein